jgi:hypothetical protein
MKKHLLNAAVLAFAAQTTALVLIAQGQAQAQTAPGAQEVAGTLVQVSNGELAKLGANTRVALTACIVEYQTSVRVEDKGGMFNRNDTATVNTLSKAPKDTLQDVVDRSCANLRDKLTKAGYQLVPDAEIKADPGFAQILALSGAERTFGVQKVEGGAIVFADSTLPFYLPYIGEGPAYASGLVAPEGAVYAQAIADAKPAPEAFALSRKYDLPNLEVALAKSLNAHLVKAWTVIGFGSASASSERDWSAFRTGVNASGEKTTHSSTNYKGEGDALFTIAEHQTRLAFRTADGKSGGYAGAQIRNAKTAPTDGDVVIKLAAPVIGGNSFFKVSKGDKPEPAGVLDGVKALSGLLGGGSLFGSSRGRGKQAFFFETTITDATAYRDTAIVAIGAAHDGFVGLLGKR